MHFCQETQTPNTSCTHSFLPPHTSLPRPRHPTATLSFSRTPLSARTSGEASSRSRQAHGLLVTQPGLCPCLCPCRLSDPGRVWAPGTPFPQPSGGEHRLPIQPELGRWSLQRAASLLPPGFLSLGSMPCAACWGHRRATLAVRRHSCEGEGAQGGRTRGALSGQERSVAAGWAASATGSAWPAVRPGINGSPLLGLSVRLSVPL